MQLPGAVELQLCGPIQGPKAVPAPVSCILRLQHLAETWRGSCYSCARLRAVEHGGDGARSGYCHRLQATRR
jgi:hypothetical protein